MPTTTAAAAAAAALEAAWGCLTLTAAGSGGLWAEHVSRSRQGASLIWKRWYVAPSGVTYQMRVEPGDPRFQF